MNLTELRVQTMPRRKAESPAQEPQQRPARKPRYWRLLLFVGVLAAIAVVAVQSVKP